MRVTLNEQKMNRRETYEDIIRDCEYQIKQLTLRKALMLQKIKELDEEDKLVGGRPR
jgi:hypothetical protein